MSNQETIFIYTLSEPSTGVVRYVGVTNNPAKRLVSHKTNAKRKNSAPVQKWIISLLDEGLEPIMDIVDTCHSDSRDEKEKYWIQWHKNAGSDLLNQTDGGVNCQYNKETRNKKSELSPNKRPIIQYAKDGTFVRNWDSVRQASRELGIDKSHIRACCYGRTKSIGGFLWCYATDSMPQAEQPSLFQIIEKDKTS